MPPLLLNGMLGLGDNIYQYPIVKRLAEFRPVYVRTPWPEVYQNLIDVHCVHRETRLRTQRKNATRQTGYLVAPANIEEQNLSYTAYKHHQYPYWLGLAKSVQVSFLYHLQMTTKRCPTPGNYAVIRPPTLRQEWKEEGRNPKPEYIQFVIDHLNHRGIDTILVADIEPPYEVYDGFRPQRATRYHEYGELNTTELMDLVYRARVVVGGVGFIVPMSIAFGTPAVILHGKLGTLNSPQAIDCPGLGKPTHVLPRVGKELDTHEIRKILDSL